MIVRSSNKLHFLAYAFTGLLLVAVAGTYVVVRDVKVWWLAVIPLFLDLVVTVKFIRSRLTTLELSGDSLIHRSGILRRSERRIPMMTFQEVHVERNLLHRLIGTGDLIVETASKDGRIVMENVDGPQAVADRLIQAVPKYRPPMNL